MGGEVPLSATELPLGPLSGQRIGSYRVVRLIGQGGMGAVYEAVHEQIDRRAAIKVLLPELSRDQEMIGRFFNEARAVNIVHHPGIVSTYEMGQLDDGTVYIVMELLEGQTLTERLEHLAGRPVRDALRLCRQVASALQAAHKKGVIHRDLKPDNIMIVADPDMPGGERTKLLDFGIAKVAERKGGDQSLRTRTGIVMGTPKYMAPEQCRGVGGITDKADVYSLGVLLYQLVAGRPPFLSEGIGDLIVQQISEAPPPLLRLEPDAPVAVAALVHEMLAKAPGERPTMAQVAVRLEQLEADPNDGALRGAASLDVTPSMYIAAPESEPEPPAPPVPASIPPLLAAPAPGPRNSGLLLGAALGILVLGGAAVLGLRALRPRPAQPAANRDGEAALLLLSADADLAARRWEDAMAKAQQVLAMGSVSEGTRDLATSRKERAEKEAAARGAYERFGAALEKKDIDQAMALFHELPEASVYRAEARAPYQKAFPAFAALHMKLAKSARHSGKCAEARAQLQLILAVEAGYVTARKALEQPCGDEEEGEEEEEYSSPVTPPLPGSVTKPAVPPAPRPQAAAPTAPAAGRPLDAEDGPRILREAQGRYSAGRYREAMELARSAVHLPGLRRPAWLLIGTAGCKLGDMDAVQSAYRQADLETGRLILQTCANSGVRLIDGRFVAGG